MFRNACMLLEASAITAHSPVSRKLYIYALIIHETVARVVFGGFREIVRGSRRRLSNTKHDTQTAGKCAELFSGDVLRDTGRSRSKRTATGANGVIQHRCSIYITFRCFFLHFARTQPTAVHECIQQLKQSSTSRMWQIHRM